MKIYIKNMQCKRCELVVVAELEKLGFPSLKVSAGEVEISEETIPVDLDKLKFAMQKLGLEIIDDKELILVEQIKTAVTEMIYEAEEGHKKSCSEHLTALLGYSYNYLSNLFTIHEGISIEKYLINQRIDRVKELLRYENITFSEVAYKLNFSSSAHLSQQFKKETGLTLTQYRKFHTRRSPTSINL